MEKNIKEDNGRLNQDELLDYLLFSQKLKYEKRSIAYIDILGWQEFIELSKTDHHLMEKMGLGLFYVKKRIKNKQDIQISQFSDSIVLSVGPSGTGVEFFETLRDIMQTYLRIRGFVFRGAITEGELFHDDNIIFGPALVKAYNLEKNANHPRVICDPESSLAKIGGELAWFRSDDDGMKFFDFFRPMLGIDVTDAHLPFFDIAFDSIMNGLKQYERQPEICKKYKWLKSYYNKVANEALQKDPDLEIKIINND